MAHKLTALLFILGAMVGVCFAQQNAPFHFSLCTAVATCCMVPAPVMTQPVPGGTPTTVPNGSVNLYGAHVTNQNAGNEYLQFFNATAQPAFGATPIGASSWFVNGSQDRDMNVGESGWGFNAGIMACCSSTQGTFTAVGNCGFLLEWY